MSKLWLSSISAAARAGEQAPVERKGGTGVTSLRGRAAHLLAGALVLLNIGMFSKANLAPNRTVQNEIISHRFFWSQQDVDRMILRSGLHPRDFSKPLVWTQIEGVFRTRQFSYLVEMLSFKFEQQYIRDPTKAHTLVGIHLLNVVLLAWLVRRLSGNGWAALATGALLLNSGVCLNTLNFSFRNAKLLVMTLFLTAGLIIVNQNKEMPKPSLQRLAAYSFVFLLALYTDEISLFILPLFWLNHVSSRGPRALLDRHFALAHLSVVLAFLLGLLVLYAFYNISLSPLRLTLRPGVQIEAMQEVKRLLLHEPVVVENIRAFFLYFFPRNFGQWNDTAWGLMGGIGMCAFLVLNVVALARRRPPRRAMIFPAMTLGVMASAALFLPHNAGVQKVLMPEGARVPTLLYFSYYESYPFAVLVCLALGSAGASGLRTAGAGLLGLLLASLVNLSNVHYGSAGPPVDGLAYHGWTSKKQESMMRIRALRGLEGTGPVYLSFPSGPDPLVDCGLSRPAIQNFNLYPCVIPVTYLRHFETGQWRMSLRNVIEGGPEADLKSTELFVDVPSGERLDLRKLRLLELGRPEMMDGPTRSVVSRHLVLPLDRADKVYLFLRGECDFTVQGERGSFSGRQTYGHSYQVFAIPVASLAEAGARQLRLNIGEVKAPATFSALAGVE